jgi:hypothetical protein
MELKRFLAPRELIPQAARNTHQRIAEPINFQYLEMAEPR